MQFDQWVNNLDLTRAFDGLFGLAVPTRVSAGLEHRWERFQTFAGAPIAYSVGPYTYRLPWRTGDPTRSMRWPTARPQWAPRLR